MTALRTALVDEFNACDHHALFRDTVISPEMLAAWVIDRTPLPTATRKEKYENRSHEKPFAEFDAMPGRGEVIDFVASYVRNFIPAPAITEDDHWVTTIPRPSARINIGPVQVALVRAEDDQHQIWLWVAESSLVAAAEDEDLKNILNDDAVTRLRGFTQPGGGTDQVSFRINTIPAARRFLSTAAGARATRLYNARQAMRRTPWHSAHVPALVDGAFPEIAV